MNDHREENFQWFESRCWGQRCLFPDYVRLARMHPDAFQKIVLERIADYESEQEALRAKGLALETGNPRALLLAQLDLSISAIKPSEFQGEYKTIACAARAVIDALKREAHDCE